MIKEWKQKWIDALRSGNYNQGKHVLYDKENNCFCCLGVLCDIMGCTMRLRDESSKTTIVTYISSWDSSVTHLPEDLANKLQIPFQMEKQLVKMNDLGYSFKEIADYIERVL